MYICHAPSTSAPKKPMKATQKWARTSLLARNTAQPFAAARAGQEFVARQHLDARPHRLVPGAAVLVARHQLLAALRKRRRERRDEAGNEHRVGVRLADDEAVQRVGRGA